MCNALVYLGTGEKKFLRDNYEWVKEFADWNKFDAVASLGVIHKGNRAYSKTILGPYLPKHESNSEFGFMEGGALYAFGLMHAGFEVDSGPVDFLRPFIINSQLPAAIRHGACLGIAAMGCDVQGDQVNMLAEELVGVLREDATLVGESAAIALSMILAGRLSEEVFNDMVEVMRTTEHEKIKRGLRLCIALLAYGQLESVEPYLERIIDDKEEEFLRQAAVGMLGMAYVGTSNASVVERLLIKTCTDPNDEVKRSAAEALGYVLLGNEELCLLHFPPLIDTYNGHVRYGSAMGLGIACATTGSKGIIELLNTALVDKEPWVRQGAYIALGLLLNQRPATDEEETLKKIIDVVIPKRSEPSVSKFGAIVAMGLVNAGMRGADFSLFRREEGSLVLDKKAICASMVFLQHWFWQPLLYFISNCISRRIPSMRAEESTQRP